MTNANASRLLHTDCNCCEHAKVIIAAAHAQGKREGLEEAAKYMEHEADHVDAYAHEKYLLRRFAARIRALSSAPDTAQHTKGDE
jgi:hypothetical protein